MKYTLYHLYRYAKQHQLSDLKAFTLVEMIMVLIITGICSWLAYTVLLNMHNYFSSINASVDAQIELHAYRGAIEYDLHQSDSVTQRQDTLIFQRGSTDVYYITNDSLTARVVKEHTHILNVSLRELTLEREARTISSNFIDDTLSFITEIPDWVGIVE